MVTEEPPAVTRFVLCDTEARFGASYVKAPAYVTAVETLLAIVTETTRLLPTPDPNLHVNEPSETHTVASQALPPTLAIGEISTEPNEEPPTVMVDDPMVAKLTGDTVAISCWPLTDETCSSKRAQGTSEVHSILLKYFFLQSHPCAKATLRTGSAKPLLMYLSCDELESRHISRAVTRSTSRLTPKARSSNRQHHCQQQKYRTYPVTNRLP
jgi:hypothetical protein